MNDGGSLPIGDQLDVGPSCPDSGIRSVDEVCKASALGGW